MGFTFIDLFSGIGGFHLGCAKNNGQCLTACDIDPIARQIYELNYNIQPHNNIKTLPYIKNVDLLCSGFPCQSHSTLGERKGMKDERGKLFLYLKTYIQESKPKAFLLENVKGLLVNNNGKYFKFIINTLKNIGYNISWCVLNSKDFGLPQNRPRVYIIGHLNKLFDFTNLQQSNNIVPFNAIIDKKINTSLITNRFTSLFDKPKHTKSGFILHAKINNYTHMKLYSTKSFVGTLATASPPIIYDERINKERHISKTELIKLQGFPASFKFPPTFSRSNYIHYLGNSVSINVIDAIIKDMIAQKLI
jgi:DNA (cytosine-5)-methyltransferase 1